MVKEIAIELRSNRLEGILLVHSYGGFVTPQAITQAGYHGVPIQNAYVVAQQCTQGLVGNIRPRAMLEYYHLCHIPDTKPSSSSIQRSIIIVGTGNIETSIIGSADV